MDRLTRIEVFIRVAEAGSFSEAARSLRASQPMVSKAVAELERDLKTRLLHRTTRSLSLTEPGKLYYDRVKGLVNLLDDANREAVTAGETIRGRIRVNTSALLAGKLVVPALVAFREAFPAVEVELVMDDRRIDPVEQATDVAVRIGALSDSTLRVRRAGTATVGVFTAAQYLERRGITADEVVEFEGHPIIHYLGQRSGVANGAAPAARLFSVSNGLLAREACLNGAGLAVIPSILVSEDVAAGHLVQVMPSFSVPPMEVSVLHPFTHDAPASVTAFAEFAVGKWREAGLLLA